MCKIDFIGMISLKIKSRNIATSIPRIMTLAYAVFCNRRDPMRLNVIFNFFR